MFSTYQGSNSNTADPKPVDKKRKMPRGVERIEISDDSEDQEQSEKPTKSRRKTTQVSQGTQVGEGISKPKTGSPYLQF